MDTKCIDRSRRRRLIRSLLLALALPPGMLLVFLLAEHLRGRIALAHYVRSLRMQGEKMSAREFLLPPQPGENGAPEVLAAAEDLQPGQVLPKTYPPRMNLLPSGRAVIGFRETQWVDDKVTYRWDALAADLKTNEATLSRIQAALAKPVLNCEFDPTLGPLARFSHLPAPKRLTQWFGPRIALDLHEGRTRETLKDLLTEIGLPRLLASDGIVISELVRVAVAGVARADTWEALQAEGWTDDDLAQVQHQWEEQHFAAAMVRALEGERIFVQSSYDRMRHSNQETMAVLFWTSEFLSVEAKRPWEQVFAELPGGQAIADFVKKQLFCRLWRFAWLDQDQLHYLRYLEGMIALGREAVRQKSLQTMEPREVDLVFKFKNKGVYDQLRYFSEMSVASLSRSFSRAMKAETERSMVVAAVAIKRYTLRHGRLPESLDALVPDLLPVVPVDYMNGQPLRFRNPPDGGFTLYSVGEDGIDDGGDTRVGPNSSSLRGWWNRKDVVWPAPANAAEVETFRRESGRE